MFSNIPFHQKLYTLMYKGFIRMEVNYFDWFTNSENNDRRFYIPATFCNNSMRHFVKFFLFFGWGFNPINEDTALWGRRFWTRERHEYLFDFPNVRKSSIFFQFYFLLLNQYNNFIPAPWQLRILFYRLVPSIFCKALGIAAAKSFYVSSPFA